MAATKRILSCVAWAAIVPSAFAQWLDYPTPGIPRTQDGKPDLSAPAPRAQGGKPDLSGIWSPVPLKNLPPRPFGTPNNLIYRLVEGSEVPLRPEAAALFKQRSDNHGAGRPSERCLPHGIPDAMFVDIFKFVQTPGLILILYQEFIHYRQIFTDGRPFPKDPQPTWLGYSVGKWDGDALVVGSTGFNDLTWLDDSGHPHTDAMHTIERFERRDFGHMDLHVTIDDVKAYTKPWTIAIQFELLPDTDFVEDVCDNEKDAQHMSAK
jgi:hypothetical protein